MKTKEYSGKDIEKVVHVYNEPHEARDKPRHDLTVYLKNGTVLVVACLMYLEGDLLEIPPTSDFEEKNKNDEKILGVEK